MSSNVFMNNQLERIADYIDAGKAGGGSLTVNLSGVGDMTGATAGQAGAHGLVPAPAAGDENKVLSGAGTWIDAGSGGELGDLEDVTITSPTSGESLKYDGAKWVNGNVTAKLPDFIEETSGNIVTVEAVERPAKNLKVAINPVQSGSGDPSPVNIRPISGWTECNVTRIGKNIVHLKDATGVTNGTYRTLTVSNELVSVSATGSVASNSIVNSSAMREVCKNRDLPPGIYSFSVANLDTNNSAVTLSSIRLALTDDTLINNGESFTLTSAKKIGYITNSAQITYKANTYIKFNLQIEMSAQASEYEPYTGTTYPITFPSEAGTVYGGTLDVTNGTLTVTKANITSYDGETLPGAWISDRDVYAEETTPTTGAQVVYDLDTPITYQLTPTEVQMLLGTNNIWADTGEVKELKYIPQTYNDLLEEVTGGGYDITTNGTPVETGITWDGYPVKCFCVRYYNLSLNTNTQDISLAEYGFSDTINGLFKVDCIVQNGDNMLNVTPHVHYDGHGNLRGRYDTSENFSYGTGYIFIYYY